MTGHQSLIVSSQTIKDPESGRDVWIVIGSIHGLRCFFVPTCPARPVEVAMVVPGRHLVGLIVEETLADSVRMLSVLELQPAIDDPVDELFKFVDLLFLRLNQLLHRDREPGASTTFIAQSRYPDTAVLQHKLAGFA